VIFIYANHGYLQVHASKKTDSKGKKSQMYFKSAKLSP